MWSYKTLTALCLCFLLSACGWHPLYMAPDGISDVSYPLKITTIADREGQILRNYLVDFLTPGGAPPHPKYVLQVTITEKSESTAIKKTEIAARKEARLKANIILRDFKTNRVVYSHSAEAINSFAVLGQNYYADLVAEEFAKREATHLLAEKIRLLVSAYFENNP